MLYPDPAGGLAFQWAHRDASPPVPEHLLSSTPTPRPSEQGGSGGVALAPPHVPGNRKGPGGLPL